MKQLTATDWRTLGIYFLAILGAVADQAFPDAFDALAGMFGAPPGLGHKLAVIAGSLLFFYGLIQTKINNRNAPATAITSDAVSVPSGTAVVTKDTPKEPLNLPTPTPSKEPS